VVRAARCWLDRRRRGPGGCGISPRMAVAAEKRSPARSSESGKDKLRSYVVRPDRAGTVRRWRMHRRHMRRARPQPRPTKARPQRGWPEACLPASGVGRFGRSHDPWLCSMQRMRRTVNLDHFQSERLTRRAARIMDAPRARRAPPHHRRHPGLVLDCGQPGDLRGRSPQASLGQRPVLRRRRAGLSSPMRLVSVPPAGDGVNRGCLGLEGRRAIAAHHLVRAASSRNRLCRTAHASSPRLKSA
jgi:hypothetical protein